MRETDQPQDFSAALLRELPRVLADTSAAPGPLQDLIGVMDSFLAGRARIIGAMPDLFDPATAPEAHLPYLANWFGYGWLFRDPVDPRQRLPLEEAFPPGADGLRSLLLLWPALQALRGSADALRLVLRHAAGFDTAALHEDQASQHIAVTLGKPVPRGWAAWLHRLIDAERPAHLTWSLSKGEQHGAT